MDQKGGKKINETTEVHSMLLQTPTEPPKPTKYAYFVVLVLLMVYICN